MKIGSHTTPASTTRFAACSNRRRISWHDTSRPAGFTILKSLLERGSVIKNSKRRARLGFGLVLALLVVTGWLALPGGFWELVAPTVHAATFQVTNTNDSGLGSLRQSIQDANANPGPDVIRVDPSLSGQTVMLQTPLPPVTDNAELDFSGIILDGSLTSGNGLEFDASNIYAEEFTVRNFSGKGVNITRSNNRVVRVISEDNLIGIYVGVGADDSTVRFSQAVNNLSAGVVVEGATGTQILSTKIDGNGDGLVVDRATDTTIKTITPEMPGDDQLSVMRNNNGFGFAAFNGVNVTLQGYDITNNNQGGVFLFGTRDSQVGAFTSGDVASLFQANPNLNWRDVQQILVRSAADPESAVNVISGNGPGIVIAGPNATGNVVGGNFIGTDRTGATPMPNRGPGVNLQSGANNNLILLDLISKNQGDGIVFVGANQNTAQLNGIGVLVSTGNGGNGGAGWKLIGSSGNRGEGNEITNNGGSGVVVQETISGTANGNAFVRNLIYNNNSGSLSLDLVGGANNGQNSPAVNFASTGTGQTTIGASLNSTPLTRFRFDFYAATSNAGPFQRNMEFHLGSTTVMTNPSGNASFTFMPKDDAANNIVLPAGLFVTATATRLDASGLSTDTSEPAPSVLVTGASTSTDISLDKTSSAASVLPGQTLTYTLTLENNGAVAASNVELTDDIPFNTTFRSFIAPPGWTVTTPAVGSRGTVTATISSLPPTGTTPLTFTLIVEVDSDASGSVDNDATASTSTPDSNPGNNSPFEDTPIPGNILDVSDVTVDEDDSFALGLITLSLSGSANTQDITVDVDTTDGSAQTDGDYGFNHSRVTIPAGATSATVSIPINDDTLVEGNENFFLKLSNANGASIGDPLAQFTVIDNDAATPTLEFSTSAYTVAENGGTATITVTRTGNTLTDVSVNVAALGGTATAGTDFITTSGTLSFATGETTKTFTVIILNDTLNEPDETVNLVLSNPTGGGVLGSNSTAVLTITNDDPQPSTLQFSSASFTVAEGGGSATITVTRTGDTSQSVSVNFAASDGTATVGSDYFGTSGTVIFFTGEVSKTITVPILDDALNEPNETVNLTLSNPTGGGTLGNLNTAVLTITDDDPQPTVAINDVSVPEGNSGMTNVVFNVGLSNPSSQIVTINFNTSDGTATAGQDYIATSGSLTFNPGETTKPVAVPVIGDTSLGAETFNVNLTGATNANIADGQGLATITDDDSALPLNANERFVSLAHVDLLNHPVDAADLESATNLLNSGQTREQVTFILVTTTEARQNLIGGFFRQYLRRAPDNVELNNFVTFLNGGGTDEQVIAQIVGSAEYFNLAANTNNGFISKLYIDALARTPSATERQNLIGLLNGGQTREQVTLNLVTSQEYRLNLVQANFQQYLRRLGSSTEVNILVTFLNAGGTVEQVISQLVGSQEYFSRIQAGFSTIEGATGQVVFASFTADNPNSTAIDFTAPINPGDGTTTIGTITPNGSVPGLFYISFAHAYAIQGSFSVSLTPENNGVPANQLVTIANVADAILTTTATTINATEDVPFTGVVASWTAPGASGSYRVTVTWGDGTAAQDLPFTVFGGAFIVNGTHTFPDRGDFAVNVKIVSDGGSFADAHSWATVGAAAANITPAGASLVNESGPPANGLIDRGERVTVNLKLSNAGTASTSNLVATLQPGNGIIAPTGSGTYGAILPGAVVGRDFSFTAGSSLANGQPITVTLQLQDGSNNLGTEAFNFIAGPLNFSGVRLVVTSSLMRTSPTMVQATINVQNMGSEVANDLVLTTAKLGTTVGTPLPQSLGSSLMPGASATAVVNFSNSTGGASLLSIGGNYAGGTFSSTKRSTVP